ncbi:hybrid sensor histidine kinase/response regulator [Methylomonas sp. MgM2]
MIADPELQKLFKAESEEHLARLDNGLLRLEKTPAAPELLEEVFRESHSLKGAASMLGLTQIETAAHRLESIFNAARKGRESLTPQTIEKMNACLADLRRRVLDALGEERQPGETSDKGAEPSMSPIVQTSAAPPLEAKSGQTHRPSPPPPPLPTPTPAPPSVHGNAAAEPFYLDTVRVETRKLDDLLTQVGELSVIQGQTRHRLSLMEELLERWAELERKQYANSPNSALQIDTFADKSKRFGCLLKQTRDAFFDDNARLQSIAQRLGDQVSNIRLLPLSTLFALFPRMVRDLAKEQGKEIDLVVEGGDITVDKRILEEMKDPLMHLIRNAVDHGVESPSERLQVNKSCIATLSLRVFREDGHVLLEVSDDGRGLDAEAIRQEAARRGLADEESPKAITQQQMQQLIFMPGFSTCRYTTALSGRGIGLDVVRVNVERLKGNISLESVLGKGLTVKLRLPLSLATARILMASVAGRLYGFPVEFVHTSLWVKPEQIFTLDGRPAILLHDAAVIVYHLADLLELATETQAMDRGKTNALACVVLQVGRVCFGLLADDLPDEEEIVLKPLGAPLKRVRNVSALAILGSGEICVVLNPPDLLSSAHKIALAGHGKHGATQKAGRPRAKPAVLLTEDSALIRAMEKRILEDADYEVITAVDGMDALNQLNSRPFAAVVADISMPNMDGLTLTERIRANPKYQDLPVILVTSLASDEDKRRGLDVGANAYIPKPTFDQRVLLDILNRLISL